MFDQSSETEGPIKVVQKKASSDRRSPRKRSRISDGDRQTNSEDNLVQTKRRRMASYSTNSDRESSNKSVEEVKRGHKRKADEDRESPERKRTKTDQKGRYLAVAQREAEFEAKYLELDLLGEGGYGAVFAGYRKADYLPVAIKHILEKDVVCKEMDANGKLISAEVAVMLKLAAATGEQVGTSGSVSLLDWYDLGEELILVLERPVPSMNLVDYINEKGNSFSEEEAKVIMKQLVDAAIELQKNHIFHRDIKPENILIETGSGVPRPRLIDFGLSCFSNKHSCFRTFYGTRECIPPEYFKHRKYMAGPATVWQLGVVLYDMLRETTQFDTNLFLRNLLKIGDHFSDDCHDFLYQCLAKIPKRRMTLKQLKRHPWLR